MYSQDLNNGLEQYLNGSNPSDSWLVHYSNDNLNSLLVLVRYSNVFWMAIIQLLNVCLWGHYALVGISKLDHLACNYLCSWADMIGLGAVYSQVIQNLGYFTYYLTPSYNQFNQEGRKYGLVAFSSTYRMLWILLFIWKLSLLFKWSHLMLNVT